MDRTRSDTRGRSCPSTSPVDLRRRRGLRRLPSPKVLQVRPGLAVPADPGAPGVELPRDVLGEMLLLAGEAQAASHPEVARARLIKAREILAANDVPQST